MDVEKDSKPVYIKNKLYSSIIIVLVNLFFNLLVISISFYYTEVSYERWISPFAVLSVVQLLINVIILAKLEKNFFSLTVLFLIFSFITHLGIIVIFGYKIDISIPWNPLQSITAEAFRKACNFTLYCQAFLAFGMCIVLSRRRRFIIPTQDIHTIQNEERERYIVGKIGKTLIIIGILPMLYIDINRIILFLNGNYLSTYEVGANGFIYTLGRMAEIGAIMLLIGNYKNKKKVYIIIFTILLYEALVMLTGNRSRPIMYLIAVFFVYYNFIKKIKLKQFIYICILLYFAGFTLTFIGQVRMMPIDSVSSLIEITKKSFYQFSIFKILGEFGVSIITLGNSLVLFPKAAPFQLGTNYLASLALIFPNIGGILSPILTKVIYIYTWPLEIRQYLGGSYLGELFYSFGDYSYFFAVFLGMVIGLISNKIRKYIEIKQYSFLSIYLILFINILWWVRDYFGDMVREFVWTSIVILILYKIFSKRIKNAK